MESVLHKRYKIAERVFSNALGELFLGRDLQASANQRLLVHYLPKQLLSDSALKQSLSTLQSLGNQAETAVLKVLDCAWSDTEVFFVLEMPEAWSLSVLPAIQGQPTNLHQKALAITQQLIDQGLVTNGIEPSLFLVTPTGELYLLGTAFLTELQTLAQQSPALLQPIPPRPRPKKHRLLALIFLGITGLVAAASLGVYQFSQPTKTTQIPIAPKTQVSVLDKPLMQNAATTSLVTIPLQPVQTPAQTRVEQETSLPPRPSTLSQSLETPIIQAVIAKPSIIEPVAVSNPIATQHLERATEAIKHGHLQTGLYYLRLAKKLSAHPAQLKSTTQQLIDQAQQTDQASETLSIQMQTSIKQEFGLE